jgi:hypothetical protein
MSPNSRLQTDLIVDAKYNARGSDNKVTFNFDHVLSRIGFKAKIPESYGATTITITRLTFFYNRLHISGTYTFNSTTGQNNKTPGNWKVPGESTVTTGTTLFSASVTLTTESEPYNLAEYHTPHRYLMLIPQENAAGQAYVTLEYTIHYPPTTPPAQSDGATVYLPHTIWEPGKAYTYTLSVAPKAVIVDVDEGVDWNDWDEVEVTPPINVQ